MNLFILAGIGVVVAASPATAGFTFTGQIRSITANASAALGAITDTHSLSAPDFAPFNASVDASATDPQFGAMGFGHANQNSTLDPLHIAAQGGWSGGRNGMGAGGGGSCTFEVFFTLDVASAYTLMAFPAANGYFFSGPNGFGISDPGSFSGVLEAGDYSLQAFASGFAGFPPSGDAFFIDLTIVPAPSSAALLPIVAAAAAIRSRRRIS